MIPFTKPGKSDNYDVMGARAATAALKDAGLEYSKVQQAYVGYVYGDSTSGQRALYNLGETGIPVINVNNNFVTGSTAPFLAHYTVASGAADCVLASGFEQMNPGALGVAFTDRPSPPRDSTRPSIGGAVSNRILPWHLSNLAMQGYRLIE
jgi:acetyl-CoA acetyltransferase